MVWITLIIDLITALPGLIKLIQEIIAAIHGQPLPQRLAAEHEFMGHVLNWRRTGDAGAVTSALHGMGRTFGCASAAPAA